MCWVQNPGSHRTEPAARHRQVERAFGGSQINPVAFSIAPSVPHHRQVPEAVAPRRNEFKAFVLEQLGAIRDLSCRPMFGGFGLRSGETFFGIIMDHALYFAVDDASRAQYENLGSKCFSYSAKGRAVDVKRYFEVPGDVMEDHAQLADFARSAIRAAHAHKVSRIPRGRKRAAA